MATARISFDFSNMLSDRIGDHGITRAQLELAQHDLAEAHVAMERKRSDMAWRALPYAQADILPALQAAADAIRSDCDDFVVLGIGGSALGSKALFSACCHPRYNLLPRERRGGPRFHVEDNVDPDKLSSLFDIIDLKRTAFHVISKSGSTVETMSQFVLVLDLLRQKLGDDFARRVYLTTDAEQGVLRQTARERGWDAFTVPEGVGGRFSVLCPVGLLSAAVLGLNMQALLDGAAAMDARCTQAELADNPAYMYALLYTLAMRQGKNISVQLPYADALAPLAEWYCQLWAESLGKAVNSSGQVVHCGQTPVRALGVTDQHSQIQLYNEGPFDKIITFIGVRRFRTELTIPTAPISLPQLEYLYGKSFNQLIDSEMQATIHAVSKNGKMNNTIMLDQLDEFTLGGLFFFFEMATATAGELLHIDAFDQPGVESGKIATYALMGRAGFERQAAELRSGTVERSFYYEV